MPASSRFTILQQPVITRQSPSRPSHLLAAYSFDTHDGSDASGRGNTLVSQGTGTSFANGVDKDATFGAGNVSTACWSTPAQNLQPQMLTFMGWVNAAATQTGSWVCAFGLHHSAATWPIWGIYPLAWSSDGSGPVVFGSDIGGGENLNYDPVSPIAGTWHHIAATFDGTTKAIYFDGILGATGETAGSFDYSSVGEFHVLGDPNYGDSRMFAGGVDDVRLYDNVLTQSEIQTCMNTPVGTAADPLMQQ